MSQSETATLHDYVRQNDLKRMEECLTSSTSLIDAQDRNGDSPIHVAVSLANVEAIRMLRRFGADIHSRDKKYASCVVKAVQQSNYEMVKELLTHGAFVNDTDASGNTLANIAAIKGDEAMLGVLQDNKASFLSRNYVDGTIPIMNAIKNKRAEAFEFLKNLDVEPKVYHIHHCRAGKTALHYAIELQYEPALNFFLSLSTAAKLVNEVDQEGDSALHYAARIGDVSLIQRLKSLGAELSLTNKAGQTAADLAQSSSAKNILKSQ